MADQSLSDIEARAQRREWSIRSRGSTTAKLKATVDSAELYMQALQIADKPQDRKRLDAKFNQLIKKAEHLKSGQDGARLRSTTAIPVSMRKLTTRESIIILEGCKLNGFVFKPWERSPLPEEFALKTGESRFTDNPSLPLSPSQLKSFGGWKRPKEAFAKIKISIGGETLPNEPTMSHREKVDLVQDLTSDCSVVASLCAGTSRVERGHVKVSLL
jgi:calpain-7